jgi:hypothetical protein
LTLDINADKIKENEIGGHVARIGEIRNAYKLLVGKMKGRFHFGARRRWEGNIKINLKEIGREGLEWI